MRHFFLLVLVAALAIGAAGCGDSDPSGSTAKPVNEFEDHKPKKEEVAAANRAAARKVRKEEKQLERELREDTAESHQAPKPESSPQSEPVSGGFTGVHASNYEVAKEICSAFPQGQIARELGLPASSGEFDIAEAYADDSYTDRFRQAGFEGCLDGLLG